jgi:hypothetical protein
MPMSAHRIPIRDRKRNTVIGYCRSLPCGSSLQLALFRCVVDAGCDGELRQVMRAELVYDHQNHCYWVSDYACLASPHVEPY